MRPMYSWFAVHYDSVKVTDQKLGNPFDSVRDARNGMQQDAEYVCNTIDGATLRKVKDGWIVCNGSTVYATFVLCTINIGV